MDIVEALRSPVNPGSLTSYPEAADEIERLRAENTRLLQNWTQAIEEVAYARKQLEAAQAREAKLRDALTVYATFDGYGSESECALAREALALPRDDSALRERLKAGRERCAKVCDEQAKEPECPERAAYCADAIRAVED